MCRVEQTQHRNVTSMVYQVRACQHVQVLHFFRYAQEHCFTWVFSFVFSALLETK
jgi:hypothetical protein